MFVRSHTYLILNLPVRLSNPGQHSEWASLVPNGLAPGIIENPLGDLERVEGPIRWSVLISYSMPRDANRNFARRLR